MTELYFLRLKITFLFLEMILVTKQKLNVDRIFTKFVGDREKETFSHRFSSGIVTVPFIPVKPCTRLLKQIKPIKSHLLTLK